MVFGGAKMSFYPGFDVGSEVSNLDIINAFKCANMGGMRRSHETKTLVLVSDYTKGPYYDCWIDGILHYTGMGKCGNQVLYGNQNITLAESQYNGVEVHLFEVFKEGVYVYCGEVELVDKPYKGVQPDENNNNRIVWIFPIRPLLPLNSLKPKLYTFSSMTEYKKSNLAIDTENVNLYEDSTSDVKTKPQKATTDFKNKKVRHKTYGIGIVLKIKDNSIYIKFENNETKQLNYKIAVEKNIIEFL